MSLLNKIFRCDCPITTALDVVGDKWTLVIIKQMLLECKKTKLYPLTTKGLSLTPVIIELALWTNYNVKPMKDNELKLWTEIEDKNKLQELIIKRYKEKTYLIKNK